MRVFHLSIIVIVIFFLVITYREHPACSQLLTSLNYEALLEWAKVTFDLLKGIAWPVSLFFLVWMFRRPIEALIPYIHQVGPSGAIFQPRQPEPPTEKQVLNISSDFATVTQSAAALYDEIERYPHTDRQSRLINALAEARVFTNFEFIFGAIYQTQVNFLNELESGDKSLEEARSLFSELVVANKGLAEWGFQNWVNFLRVNELINSSSGKFSLTTKGKDFVLFIRKYRLGVSRPN